MNLQVDVRFYGFVRDVLGRTDVALEMPAQSTLGDLVNRLVKNFGDKLRERLLTTAGDLEANVKVFVGETQTADLEKPLADRVTSSAQVKVFVLTAISGG